MKPIDLAGFADKFARDDDPWSTWTDPDEVRKRQAILHALPSRAAGRILELGAGNGSNSNALAKRCLRLDATEATAEGTRLVGRAIADQAGARAFELVAPARPPRPRYDVIVIAELLYYLSASDMAKLARQAAHLLDRGGVLVLAHHRITFYDFAQHAEGIQRRFLARTGVAWNVRTVQRSKRWSVLSCTKKEQSNARPQGYISRTS